MRLFRRLFIKHTPSNFLRTQAVHLTYATKQNEYEALCSKGGEIRETKIRISYIDTLKAATIYSIQKVQKLSTWLMFRVSVSPCVI